MHSNLLSIAALFLATGCAEHVLSPPTAPRDVRPHVVLVAGDEEYRSEQSMPQLASILEQHHGMRCTVVLATDPKTGAIDPTVNDHLPGLEALASADLLVLFVRFRDLPDADMRYVADYVESGKPIVGLRTSTHAFRVAPGREFARYSFDATDQIAPGWDGGFGRRILGETWIAHHGDHGIEGTRGRLPELRDASRAHPILRGIDDGAIFDPADVYTVRLPLPADCLPLVFGEVTASLDFAAPPSAETAKNDPRMPIAWTRERALENGSTQRVFTTTLGSAQAFLHQGTRRLLVNACFWALHREAEITPTLDVSLVGEFVPLPFGFGGHARAE